MRQKISISRWNIGEASQRSIGDFDQPAYSSTCRFLNNFVVSETGKLWRRPGFIHHVLLDYPDDPDNVRIIPLYLANDSYILVFYLEGSHPTQEMKMDWFKLVNGRFTNQATIHIHLFDASAFEEGRPLAVDLKRLSYVQVESGNQYIYMTHANIQDPIELKYNISTGVFTMSNFSTSLASYYYDINYVAGSPDRWDKKIQVDFNVGGGARDPAQDQGSGPVGAGDAGWTAYTGYEFNGPNQGKATTPSRTFKYLTCVTFSYERLVWARGPRVHGSGGGDPLACGLQYNGDIPSTVSIDPYTVIASDPFLYRAGSDLGYEDFQWLSGGPLLMGGANNGAWVLSNSQAGGLDATNPLMYKSSSNGCHWVPGKTIGDAMVFFQRPGRQLNEFLYANASQNYVATNLSEFSDHLFFDQPPVEMQVQRSPFNVAWIVREDGVLVSFTYDRQRQIYAWARHDFTQEIDKDEPVENGTVKSLAIYSDGVVDRPVIYSKRSNAEGTYYGLEMMDFYTPDQITGAFVDASVKETLKGPGPITDIVQDDTNGHWLFYDETQVTFADGETIRINGASRTDDGVQPVVDNHYDYIYGAWDIFDHDGVAFKFRIKDQTGEPYVGIWEHVSDPATENAYIEYGTAYQVTLNPLTASLPDYAHLKSVSCKALMDGNPKTIYVSSDGTTFFNGDTIPDDWDGNEDDLTESAVFWNNIIIGRPYDSLFAPFIMKKQINKGKLNDLELEVFRSLGGRIGTATISLDNKLENLKTTDLVYPSLFEQDQLYTGTLKPPIVGGYGDDPLWFVLIDDAVPFNITNALYFLEAN